jgi:hypothetical protein
MNAMNDKTQSTAIKNFNSNVEAARVNGKCCPPVGTKSKLAYCNPIPGANDPTNAAKSLIQALSGASGNPGAAGMMNMNSFGGSAQ